MLRLDGCLMFTWWLWAFGNLTPCKSETQILINHVRTWSDSHCADQPPYQYYMAAHTYQTPMNAAFDIISPAAFLLSIIHIIRTESPRLVLPVLQVTAGNHGFYHDKNELVGYHTHSNYHSAYIAVKSFIVLSLFFFFSKSSNALILG